MASIKLPTFPAVDLSSFDLSKINVPKIKMPKINMPKVDVSTVDSEAVANVAKDAAYMTIGLVVLAMQKAQTRRREFSASLNNQVGAGRSQMDEVLATIEARLAGIDAHIETLEGKLDVAVVDLEKRLPVRAGALLGQAHGMAKGARKQVRGLIVAAA